MAPHSPQASQCTQAPVAGCGSGQWCQDGAAAWLQHLQLPSCPSCTGAMGLREGIVPSAQINLQILVVVSFSFLCSGGSGSPRASCHLLPEGAGWFGSVSKAELVPVWCQCPQGCQCPVGALRVPSVSILPAGVQRQVVHCVERLAGLVEERFCDALTRPDDQQRTCSEEPCPARCDPTLLLPSPSLWGWVPGCVGP